MTEVDNQTTAVKQPPKNGPVPLEVREISKSYAVVKALSATSLELRAGEIHALVGENGSGKSTFVNIVSGTVKPDSGEVVIGGKRCSRHAPAESQRLGALTVFQDGSVLADLTVAQNLYLGTPAGQRPSYRGHESWAAAKIAEFGLGRMSVRASAGRLPPADRQLLEIARALMARPKVLLLDEATSALDSAGVDVALEMIRRAAGDGCAVLMVTHRLSEVFRVADRISVLRDGVFRGTHEADAIDVQQLVSLMAGTTVDIEFPDRARPEDLGEIVLRTDGICGPGYGPVDLGVRAGEIVGLAGAEGNGQADLLRGLSAVDVSGGLLTVKGEEATRFAEGVKAGVAVLPSDRREQSLFQTLAIRENLVVGVLGALSRWGFVPRGREGGQVDRSIEDFGIRLGSPEDPIGSLSGGNQQKVALARVLATEPDVLLTDEPTQGVDVRSRIDIYHMLRDSARRGLAVVMVSSDASELVGLCDRIVVLSRGRIVAELAGESASEDSVVGAFAAASAAVSAPGSPPAPEAVRAGRERGRRSLAGVGGVLGRYRDGSRLGLLALVLVLLGLYAQSQNSTFLTSQSIYNLTLLALPLAIVAAAQFAVMFVGGIDISIAGTVGVVIVLLSFLVESGGLIESLLIAFGIAVGVGVVVGGTNATLIERIKISPVIVTIATLGVLQGIGLVARPTAGGLISASLIEAMTEQVWVMPVALIAVAAVLLFADLILRGTGIGLRLRAVGLNPQFAFRLGVNAPRLRQLAYVVCAIVAGLGGIVLAGQVGTGDSTVGSQYTLLAIAAPILGGASLLGGRGTFVGCLLGALLLALAQSLPTTLHLEKGTNYLFTGGLTLLALLIYTSGAGASLRTYGRTLVRVMRPARVPITEKAE
jgi:ribose transport system ATP-binding protein